MFFFSEYDATPKDNELRNKVNDSSIKSQKILSELEVKNNHKEKAKEIADEAAEVNKPNSLIYNRLSLDVLNYTFSYLGIYDRLTVSKASRFFYQFEIDNVSWSMQAKEEFNLTDAELQSIKKEDEKTRHLYFRIKHVHDLNITIRQTEREIMIIKLDKEHLTNNGVVDSNRYNWGLTQVRNYKMTNDAIKEDLFNGLILGAEQLKIRSKALLTELENLQHPITKMHINKIVSN